ncbi:hypothetical protein Bca52824_054720 [Brassica carinata]|uniref:Uncharacterized protein n=1 Tax=Brassica carinata TaxID=52824 RepID=A0A8X7UKR4_BRACI|nr:hypothetical protein Bca52824_054720 [Brassica carinata]
MSRSKVQVGVVEPRVSRSSIFTHGVQEIIQMDLKTIDRAFHVSGILSRAQLDIWSPSVGVEAISNEHFRVDYTRSVVLRGTKLLCNCEEFLEKICVIDLDAAKSFENGEGVRLIAPQDACKLQPFSQVYSHGHID